jgi:CBS domain-containing protein
MIRARDIMTKRVAGIHPKSPVDLAVDLMACLDVSSLPVIDVSGVVVGMLTARDIIRRIGAYDEAPADDIILLEKPKSDQPLVEQIMTPWLCTVQDNVPIADVATLMRERGIKRLPVLKGEKIVGMIHSRELAAVLGADFDTELESESRPDIAIKDAVHATLEELKWVPSPLIDVTVQGGNVTLRGTLLQEDEREPLRAAIETIPGVARYTDNLALADAADDVFPPHAGETMRRQKLL